MFGGVETGLRMDAVKVVRKNETKEAPKTSLSPNLATFGGRIAARLTSPSLKQLQGVVAELDSIEAFGHKPSKDTLDIYLTALQARLIPTFLDHGAGRKALAGLFGNPSGLACIVSHVRLGPQQDVADMVTLLEYMVEQISVPALLKANHKEMSVLFFGSRLQSVVASKPGLQSWIGDVVVYSQWLSRIMIADGSTDLDLFEKGLKLGAPQEYIREYLQDTDRINLLAEMIKRTRGAQQTYIVSHALLPLLPSRPGHSSRILATLHVHPEVLAGVCIRKPANTSVIRAAVILAKHTGELEALVERLGSEWASSIMIGTMPLGRQQAVTQYLLAACASMDSGAAKRMLSSSVLTEGVANHLESTSPSIRNLGTLLGEAFAKQAGSKLEFGIKYDDHDWWIGIDSMDDELKPLGEKNEEEGGSKPSALENILNPPEQPDSDDEEAEIFGDDAESDEEAAPLYYVKDLLAYLRSDTYAEVACGLATGASLILRKAHFGTEVPHYAPELLRTTCGLTDKYSIRSFAEQRQSILNALVTAAPEVTAPVVVELFATGDWSIAQRQSLLAALAFGAHALAEDEERPQFERLPGALHSMFVSPRDTHLRSIEGSTSSANQLANQLSGLDVGQVVRRSRKLDTQPQKKSRNRFSPLSAKFFFPLFAAQPPLRQSSYDAIIYSQWLRTLSLLMIEAYPSQHIVAMTNEFWPFIKHLVVGCYTKEVVVQEAIYVSVAMLISVAGALIVQSFASDVGIVLDEAAAGVSRATTPQVRDAAMRAVAALSSLAQQIEQRFLAT